MQQHSRMFMEDVGTWTGRFSVEPGNYCEREPVCSFVESCRMMVKQVDGDEQVENSKEQVPCNSMIGWKS